MAGQLVRSVGRATFDQDCENSLLNCRVEAVRIEIREEPYHVFSGDVFSSIFFPCTLILKIKIVFEY